MMSLLISLVVLIQNTEAVVSKKRSTQKIILFTSFHSAVVVGARAILNIKFKFYSRFLRRKRRLFGGGLWRTANVNTNARFSPFLLVAVTVSTILLLLGSKGLMLCLRCAPRDKLNQRKLCLESSHSLQQQRGRNGPQSTKHCAENGVNSPPHRQSTLTNSNQSYPIIFSFIFGSTILPCTCTIPIHFLHTYMPLLYNSNHAGRP